MAGRLIVGIDLGTTHTVVAWADPRKARSPEVFPVRQLVGAAALFWEAAT